MGSKNVAAAAAPSLSLSPSFRMRRFRWRNVIDAEIGQGYYHSCSDGIAVCYVFSSVHLSVSACVSVFVKAITRRDSDDVSHCRILPPDKTEWRLISATLCG